MLTPMGLDYDAAGDSKDQPMVQFRGLKVVGIDQGHRKLDQEDCQDFEQGVEGRGQRSINLPFYFFHFFTDMDVDQNL